MEPLVELFRQHLESEKRASANTVRAYLADLQELFAHVHAHRGEHDGSGIPLVAQDLDTIACRSFLAGLHGHNDPASVGRKLSSLKTFFRLLVRRKVIAANPLAALRGPK